MKKKLFITILLLMMFIITGCTKNTLNSSRYTFGLEGDSVFSYYKCDNGKKICDRYLYLKDVGESYESYEYAIIKKQNDNTYLVTFNNLKKPNESYTLIYNYENDTLYDSDLDITYSENSFIGNIDKYNNIYNEVKKYDTGLSLYHSDGLNYESIEYDKDNKKIVLHKSRVINNNEVFNTYLTFDTNKGFESNEFKFIHNTFINFDKREYDNTHSAIGKFKIKDSFIIDELDLNISFEYNGLDEDKEIDVVKQEIKKFFLDTDNSLKQQFKTNWYELGFYKYLYNK